jgi:hypothetical protein
LFLLPDHDHDYQEVILPSCKGELPEHFLMMTNEELGSFEPYHNYDCIEMN